MRAVEVDAPGIEFLHFALDGAGDDVAGGEFEAGVVVVHEASAEVIAEGGAGAAEGFGKEESLELGVGEGGGVKLHELEVLGSGADAVGEGDAVGGGDARVGGGGVDFSAAASGEHGGAGREGAESDFRDLRGGSDAPALVDQKFGDEGVFKDADVGIVADGLADDTFDFPSGLVGVVDDPVARVSAFSAEVEAVGAIEIEPGPISLEPFYGVGGVLDEEPDGGGVVKPGTGDHGVFFVEFPAVGFADGGGDTALCPVGVGIYERGFGEDGDGALGGGL